MINCNIVFASDRSYLPHLSVAIASLIDKNSELIFNIYIINTDISPIEWADLLRLDKKNEHTFINAQIDDSELIDLVTSYHFTKANYYRLFIPDIIPYDKALYIDSDVVVNGNLSKLWTTDISGVFLAAVEEPSFDRHDALEMNVNSSYFNSGVMLLNLDKWRKYSVRNKVFEFVRRKAASIQFVDQCGLNAVIDGKWLKISPVYNMQTAILDMDSSARKSHYDFSDIDYAVKTPVIIHYTGSSKPWHFLNTHPFKKKYWGYLRKTKYKRLLPIDFTIKKFLIKCIPEQYRSMTNSFRKVRLHK